MVAQTTKNILYKAEVKYIHRLNSENKFQLLREDLLANDSVLFLPS